MPPPPPRKPAAPKKPTESFIGNDSATMMSEETFEEFEARMKAEEDAKGTNTNPALEEEEQEEDQEEQDEAEQKRGPG